ncbi:hypothetical protein CEXT_150601 [Caerostris extrusa]|uniref:Uncharacterized protein n=1 Tax=Caerostris extrusa TaxID=172846 RepID=A0AAV4QDW8_CAEEX|nr:hypothetical protein CEXT_150601 [Caerostris extrusa]
MAGWNVLILNHAGALKELRNILFYLSCGTAREGSNIIHFKEATLFVSGGDRHEFATGLVVSKTMKQNVFDFTPFNNRLCSLRLRSYMLNISNLCICLECSSKEQMECWTEEQKVDFLKI